MKPIVQLALAICAFYPSLTSAAPKGDASLSLGFYLAENDKSAVFSDKKENPATSVFVEHTPRLTEKDIAVAKMDLGMTDSEGQIIPAVAVMFNDDGKRKLAAVTRQNVGHKLAIVLNGKLLMAPIIREEISAGTANISGNFTPEEAQGLVDSINRIKK